MSNENKNRGDTARPRSWSIATPVKTFTGVRCGVEFKDGYGSTCDPDKASACRDAGYEVVEAKAG